MELCLVNNDPVSTLLVTPDGIPMYAIETPKNKLPVGAPAPAIESSTSSERANPKTPTIIRRLDRWNATTGHVETQIGAVEYQNDIRGSQLQFYESSRSRELVLSPLACTPRSAEVGEISWEFIGPDNKPYKWLMFVHSPVLMVNDNSHTPLARYRRAKLGIVSRSRRAFLEILPAGINVIDLIVMTFVTFMKQRVAIENCWSSSASQAET